MYKLARSLITLQLMAACLSASLSHAQSGVQNPPPGAVPPPGPRLHPPPAADDLPVIDVQSKVQTVTVDPRGLVDGLILEDGTRVLAGRKAHLERLALKPGDRVAIQGRGGSYPEGQVLQLETITLADGRTLALDVPPERQPPVTHEGIVERVLLNPEGDVDARAIASKLT
jgi:hypothetical protein